MAIETYRLEVREAGANGIDADVYDADGLVAASTHVSYDDFGLEPPDSREESPSRTEEVTADAMTIDLQYERDDGGFAFRLLGDRDELARVRIDDGEWDLA